MENTNSSQSFQYDAFISYRHTQPDICIAKKLMEALEGYRAPGEIAKKCGRRRIDRIFRDREELPTTTNLSDSILHALKSSRYLIVICSPRTPESQWVRKEIELFKELRGSEYIQSLLIEGEPYESFPEPLNFDTQIVRLSDGSEIIKRTELELLAADIRPEDLKGKDRLSYGISPKTDRALLKKSIKLLKTERLRCLAPMFKCAFDALYQRHIRRMFGNVLRISGAVIAILAIFGLYAANMNVKLARQTKIAVSNEARAKANAEEARRQADIARVSANEAVFQKGEAIRQAEIARQNEIQAIANANEAEKQRRKAEYQTEIAVMEKNNAKISESNSLMNLAESFTKDGDYNKALVYLARAIRVNPNNKNAVFKMTNLLAQRPYPLPVEGSSNYRPFMTEYLGLRTSLENELISPDGQYVLCKDDSKNYYFVKDKAGIVLYKLDMLQSLSTSACFSPNSKYILSNSVGSTAKLWDAKTGTLLLELQHNNYICDPSFSPDGSKILVIPSKSSFEIYDLRGNRLCEPVNLREEVSYCYFVSDGKNIITKTYEGKTSYWSMRPKPEYTFNDARNTEYNSIALLPGGEDLLLEVNENAANYYNLKIYNFLSHKTQYIMGVQDTGNFFAVNTKEHWIARADKTTGKKLVLVDYTSGRTISEIAEDDNYIFQVKGSRNGRYLSYTSSSGYKLIEVSSGKIVRSGPGHCIAFTQDDSNFFIVTDKEGILIDVKTGRIIKKYDLSRYRIQDIVSFSTDKKKIILDILGEIEDKFIYDKKYIILDVDSGKTLAEYPYDGFGSYFTGFFKFSKDGKFYAVVSNGGYKVYDAKTLKNTFFINNAREVSFSNNGKWIASCCTDGYVRIYDISTGQTLCSLNDKDFADMEFSRDDRFIITSSKTNGLQMWYIGECLNSSPPDWLASLAETVAGEALNNDASLIESISDRAGEIEDIRRKIMYIKSNKEWSLFGQWILGNDKVKDEHFTYN